MTTIEERAKDFAKEKCKCDRCRFCYDYADSTCDKYNLYVKLYNEIATEQQKIDIEKACEWLKQRIPNLGSWIDDKFVSLPDQFRKAMEEQI